MSKKPVTGFVCEVCGNDRLTTVLDLGLHPMCDDLVKVGDARICREYPIEILFCNDCRTAHQRFQIPKQELFPKTYHYRSRFTADVLSGMSSLVESCEKRFGSLAGKRVVDIGCNDGSLLGFFRAKGAVTIGIEPTDACLDAKQQGHVAYNGFLSEKLAGELRAAHGAPDFIVFTNVFAHIENLGEVILSLKALMSADTVIVIENHYLGSVLQGNQFDTFYHEHPRTYSYTSFRHIAQSLGVKLSGVEFPSRYGGNIRVYLGGNPAPVEGAVDLKMLDERESHCLDQFDTLGRNVERWRMAKRTLITRYVQEGGPLKAKAFPGRAAILVKLLDLDCQTVVAVYEKSGSMKIGHYLPGTRSPILSDDELFGVQPEPQVLLNLAWHISKEIQGYLKQHGFTGQVVDIIAADDFTATV